MTSKEWNKKFSIALHNKMWTAEVTSSELAEHTNLSKRIINRYLTGETMPSAVNVIKIADALNCTTNVLMDFHEMVRD